MAHARRWLLASGLGLLLATPARADLQSQMNEMLDSLVNLSEPTTFDTARLGGLTGGNLYVRNRILDENLVAFVPPSFNAGCGGLDFFAGSFSFINADQFVALMKATAANAAGYAFQVALSSMCETCMGAIETLQKKVQELNQFFGNSCQMAQGLVNDTMGAMGFQRQNEASLIGTVRGVGDVFEAFWGGTTGETPDQRAAEAAPEDYAQRVQGNIVWRALRRHGVESWFLDGDMALLEVAMNVTGTIIVGPLEDDAAELDQAPRLSRVPAQPELVRLLVDGGTATIQRCANGSDADACTELTGEEVTVTGFRELIDGLLRGTATAPGGLIGKIARNDSGSLSEAERRLVGAFPSGAGGLVVRLAQISEPAGLTFADQAGPLMAVELAEVIIRDLIKAVDAAVAGSEEAYASEVRQMLAGSRRQVDAQLELLQLRHGSLPEIIASYNEVMAVMPRGIHVQTAGLPR